MIKHIVGLVTGIVFGVGLAVSQMMNPEKVLAFLDISGDWDPSLALVMGGAVGVTLLLFPYVLRREAPLFASRFELPKSAAIDAPLIVGATIFGVGWGIAGYCPGPAIAALATGSKEPWIFVLAFVVGNSLSVLFDKLRFNQRPLVQV